MSQSINFHFLLGFTEVFPNEKPAPFFYDYLQPLPKSFILDLCAELLSELPTNTLFSDYKNFIRYLFKSTFSIYAQLIRQVRFPVTSGMHPIYIIGNHFAVLRIAEYAVTMPETTPDPKVSNEASRIEFLKSLLVINDEIRQKDDYLDEISESLDELESFTLALISNMIAYHEILNFDYQGQILCGVYKSVQLFSFLESYKDEKIDLQKLLYHFLSRHGKNSPSEFQNDIRHLLTFIPFGRKNKNSAFQILNNTNYDQNRKFLEEFVIKDNLEYDPIFDDFPTLRNKPLFKIAPDTYKILCGVFLIQKMYKGLYFSIRDVLSGYEYATEKKKKLQINTFRQLYTEEFSEKYLLYNIIEEIYGQKYIRFNDKNLSMYQIAGAPDYYFRSSNTLFLFESKDFLIKATIKQSYKPNEILSELRKSLYINDQKSKAVKQLANSIKKIINGEWKFDKGLTKPQNVTIYPVIIIHDSAYDVSGLFYWVNKWFNAEVTGMNRTKIKPVILVPIDALIKLIPYLKGRQPQHLSGLLDNYIEKQKNKNSILTFSSYLASSIKNEKKEKEYYRKMLKPIDLF